MSSNQKINPITIFTPEKITASFRKICKDGQLELDLVAPFLADLGYERTPDQISEYQNHIKELFGGRLSLELAISYLMGANDTEKLMEAYVLSCDLNNDGFISESEFKICLRTLIAHDPAFPKVSFEDFMKQADTNKDGKISVEETIAWVHKTLESLK